MKSITFICLMLMAGIFLTAATPAPIPNTPPNANVSCLYYWSAASNAWIPWQGPTNLGPGEHHAYAVTSSGDVLLIPAGGTGVYATVDSGLLTSGAGVTVAVTLGSSSCTILGPQVFSGPGGAQLFPMVQTVTNQPVSIHLSSSNGPVAVDVYYHLSNGQ